MIKYIYAFREKLAGFYRLPETRDLDKDQYSETFAQQCFFFDNKTKDLLVNCECYCLGSFDNISGEIKPEKTYLFDCATVIATADKSKNMEHSENKESVPDGKEK